MRHLQGIVIESARNDEMPEGFVAEHSGARLCVSEFDLVTRASAILATAAASGPEALAAAVVFYANWDAPPLATEIE
mgnify:CR=1